MDKHNPNPNPETAAESDGVGSPAGVEDAASESPPVDPQAELQDLDASLSEMTNLLLSGEEDDPFDVEGDFADPDGMVADAPHDAPPAPQPNPQPDPLAELDQVQAAVEAALEEAAEDLGGAPELDDAAAEAAAGDSAAGDAPRTDAPTDELEGGEPEGREFEDQEFEDPKSEDQQFEDQASEEPAPEAAEPLVDSDAAMEAVSESLEDQFTDPEHPVAGMEAPGESSAEPEPAAAVRPAHPADPKTQDGGAPTTTPVPADAQAAAPAGNQTSSSEAPPPQKPAAKHAPKIELKTRLLMIAGPIGKALAAKAGDLLARGIEPLAASLAGQPKVMRHSLAWLALATAFNAGVIWSYLIFFRSNGQEVDPAAMTQITGSEAAPGAEGMPGRPGSPAPAGTIDPAAAILINPAGR